MNETEDPRVMRLKTPEDCEAFALNVVAKYPDLAKQARRRGVQLRAARYGAKTEAEMESVQAVFAFEEVRSQMRGKRVRASRTWQAIKRDGILPTVEKVVARARETEAYEALMEAGMSDYTFEAVVVRHPDSFSAQALGQARARLDRDRAEVGE